MSKKGSQHLRQLSKTVEGRAELRRMAQEIVDEMDQTLAALEKELERKVTPEEYEAFKAESAQLALPVRVRRAVLASKKARGRA
jgi:hypothetical protein